MSNTNTTLTEDLSSSIDPINNQALTSLSIQTVQSILLQITDTIISKIRPIIADEILKLRMQLIDDNEFVSIPSASKILNISYITIRNWIDKDLILSFKIEGRKVVSLTDLRNVKENIYQPNKANRKSYRTVNKVNNDTI
jgi:hypothetical protein